ncbi:hypothetical protein H6G54_14725 [Anabaena cylindrica FACHB-243]|uniref:Uncharacterized protein n=1 Tax=Anabaena cylindrica (strain ATCC 27899 / PCC 7122) TaxID=272123 RepID=K9ZP85_ANACC|nr:MULTISPECIES: hypothetical protein [Anabaena]AFZ60342.1 hypothetical protein Anacy_5002 [Anabaena cylindrica PCC 7122]MBD2418932.1 hypothetical protein [Anabaena cylindrica FACHB-243]MCM2404523.1 hypothetical protein [Anabaena sp. CCAP 1446/1C]BAY02587.1 hypothetical protein NIES19_18330 [Anabaena cylindrica PCC 7122]
MTYEHRIKQALQWWSYRQFVKLFLEAEKIRDGLLQESFTIRRSLDALEIGDLNLSINKISDYIKKIDNFHHSLVQLSDRLCPVYIQDSLPFSIQCLLDPWLASNPHLYFHIDLPIYWRQEPIEYSVIILRTLEELLSITIPKLSTQVSVYISLKLKKNTGKLKVKITDPDISTLIYYSNLPELKYLSDSFEFLLSGKCFYNSSNLKIVWCFCW